MERRYAKVSYPPRRTARIAFGDIRGADAAVLALPSSPLIPLLYRLFYISSALVVACVCYGLTATLSSRGVEITSQQVEEILFPSTTGTTREEWLREMSRGARQRAAGQVHYLSQLIARLNSKVADPTGLAKAIVLQSQRAGVDPLFVAAVIKAESTFRHNVSSPVGARGLMQLLPTTAQYISQKTNRRWEGISMLSRPEYNIELGIAYLQYLERYFGRNKEHVLIAYNWGPANLNQALREGRTPPLSTRNYARTILSDYARWKGDFEVKLASFSQLDLEHLIG